MGNITQQIKKEIDRHSGTFLNDPKFKELQQFYLDMQAKGIAKKQEYSLPQLDTIGYQSSSPRQ